MMRSRRSRRTKTIMPMITTSFSDHDHTKDDGERIVTVVFLSVIVIAASVWSDGPSQFSCQGSADRGSEMVM